MQQWNAQLASAVIHAQAAEFPKMLSICESIFDAHKDDPDAMVEMGGLLLNFGYISFARKCLTLASTAGPQAFRAQLSLANCYRDTGEHALAHDLIVQLQNAHPDNPVIWRNALLNHQYNPHLSDQECVAQAQAWGRWAIARAGGEKPRPISLRVQSPETKETRRLRVGYVSADLCQHTVGLFVKEIFKSHCAIAASENIENAVEVFAYSSGHVSDWVTQEIAAVCTFRQVSNLDGVALANLIKQDQIDVLVDLSGHTGGSRLTVFAFRPAPVQVAWLGYFATTGLPYIDAVLLDSWHAPPGTEAQFTESIVRLPQGRLCYQPVPWAPEVSPPPCLQSHQITFGSFNNTSKLNQDVFDVWAQVLLATPNSKLILKWRTLADEALCESIRQEFSNRGVHPDRLELRTASFHVDVLKQYADIDIALDPFPFTGGLTSCETLWMGVPLVTLPQSRVVSRQSHALLSAIGLEEFIAKDKLDYVHIAQSLAADPTKLVSLRQSMREQMQASPLMQVEQFTRSLEETYYELMNNLAVSTHSPTAK